MIITAYRSRLDISEDAEERIDVELTDEVILRIGKRFLELSNTVQRKKLAYGEGTEEDIGGWEMFDLITSAYHGKRYYFKEGKDIVYSRQSRKYMSMADAIDEFIRLIDGSDLQGEKDE